LQMPETGVQIFLAHIVASELLLISFI
jgi:hypothetical protein